VYAVLPGQLLAGGLEDLAGLLGRAGHLQLYEVSLVDGVLIVDFLFFRLLGLGGLRLCGLLFYWSLLGGLHFLLLGLLLFLFEDLRFLFVAHSLHC
jgi:hypothetical protein